MSPGDPAETDRKDVFDRVREACAHVVATARHVRIDHDRLAAAAAALAAAGTPPVVYDTRYHHRGTAQSTLAFVVTLDAVNFGSGWFPHLCKPGSLSGYLTVAGALKQRFDVRGPLSARELVEIDDSALAELLGQDLTLPPVGELIRLYARALNDLGSFLLERFAGSFEALIEEASGSAARLVDLLATMPFYRDVARHAGREVPFYKRAQITASDLAAAFEGQGPGSFEDVDKLTAFADNLVPHVLRHDRILVVESALAEHIAHKALLPAGSPEEVELRAAAVHAVECLVGEIRARGGTTSARALDSALWTRGQNPEVKARPRHRTRTVYY
ncbi:MAG TPA: queuosine salvage family protein [Myxococcota bacterium]|nr:queuosine salvage family protein [Myxococcota bacterium]